MSIKSWVREWLLDEDSVNCVHRNEAPMLSSSEPNAHNLNRTFVVTEALNGSYITFTRRKYNPNGPDDYRHEVYLVQNGEALIDAISTVLVLTEK